MGFISTFVQFVATSGGHVLERPNDFPWELLLLHGLDFIQNYGLRIVLFACLLKLLLSPLDVYGRYKMRKNARISLELKDRLDDLKRQHADDMTTYRQKEYMMKRQGGVSMLGACLPMLVSIGMSFWVWGSVRSMSDYGNMRQYLELYDVYTQSYDKHYEENKQHYEEKENIELSTRLAQQEVLDFFKNSRDADSFLMIKNVWAADVPWSSAIPDSFSDTKYTDPNRIFELDENGNIQVDKDGNKIHMEGGEFEHMMSSYDKVTAVLRADSANSNNGYLIVVLVSSGIMMISQLVMARAQRASGMTPTLDPTENPILSSMQVNMKLMVYVMPAIMAVFMLIQPAAFAMYMGVGSATTLIISTTSTQIMKMLEKRHEKEIVNTVQKYGRPDPKDLIDTKDIEFDKEDKK